MTEPRRNADLRRANVLDVLDHLRTGKRMSRSDLAARTTLSHQALATILNVLVNIDLVVLVEVHGERRHRGRPALLYEYNAQRTTIISMYVGLRYTELQFCDGRGIALLPNDQFSPGWDPAVIADEAAARINSAITTLKTRPENCVAAVVVHGTVDSGIGVASIPAMGWDQVSIAAMLAERTGVEFSVQEGCRSAAIAEYQEGAAQGSSRSVVLNLGPEFGAVLIDEGVVVSGSSSRTGKLGGTLAPIDDEVLPLEDLIGSFALKERYSKESGTPVQWMSDVHRLARSGDPIAKAIVGRAAEGISFAASWLIAIHDPERLVITGSIRDRDQAALSHLVGRIADRCDPRFLEHTSIEISPLGRAAWTRGGVYVAMERHRQLEAAMI